MGIARAESVAVARCRVITTIVNAVCVRATTRNADGVDAMAMSHDYGIRTTARRAESVPRIYADCYPALEVR